MRGSPEENAVLHRGGWVKSAAHSHEVRGKTFGIVGYGHIGTQVGVLAEQLGMNVLFHDVEARLPLCNAREEAPPSCCTRPTSSPLHVLETAQSANLIGAAQLGAMKPGSHLINASRGSVVDIEALGEALERGRLRT
jgi:D-3-phosphoglycerate dehydrogenase